MYYLQSRYYDPAIGRFINADTFATTDANGFLSCNMFAYCENDPVNRSDIDGSDWRSVCKFGIVLSFTINAKKELDEERWRSIMVVVFSILNTIDCISYLFSCISSSTIWKWTGAIISFCLVLMIIFESYGSGRKDSKNAKEAGKGYSRDSNAINRTTEEKKIKS